MCLIKIDKSNNIISINSVFNIYGTYANEHYAQCIKNEIETMWNAPKGIIQLYNLPFYVRFNVEVVIYDLISPTSILENENYLNKYIRIEEISKMQVSFVDGINASTGYFTINNLEQGTTVAHEFGHMLGLKHPENLDYRGKGRPHIMYPRGTLVDAEYQYDANAIAGQPGGTVNPTIRLVTQENIDDLKLADKIENGQAHIGKISTNYHDIFTKTISAQLS